MAADPLERLESQLHFSFIITIKLILERALIHNDHRRHLISSISLPDIMAAVTQQTDLSSYLPPWNGVALPKWDDDVPPPSLDDLQRLPPQRPIDPENYRYQKFRPYDWQCLTAERRAQTDAYLRVKETNRQLDEMTRRINEEYWEEFHQREAMDRCPSPDYHSMPGYCEEYQGERAQRMDQRRAQMKKHHCPSPDSTPPGSPAISRPIPNKRKRPAEPEPSIPEQMARLVAWHEAQQEPSSKRQKLDEELQPAEEAQPADDMQLVEENQSGEQEPPAEQAQPAEGLQSSKESDMQPVDELQLGEEMPAGEQDAPAGIQQAAEEMPRPQQKEDLQLNEEPIQQKRKRVSENLVDPLEEAGGRSLKKRKIAEPVSRNKTTREILKAAKQEAPRRPSTRSRPGTTASLDLTKKGQIRVETQPSVFEVLSMEDYMKRLQDGHDSPSTPPHATPLSTPPQYTMGLQPGHYQGTSHKDPSAAYISPISPPHMPG